ncbi:MAG TPA: hypothetical protein VMT81_00870, partial [Candidatus Paceibacterota bacterium]|nr:hypothetical protein [Candidatus Paceibacterota bacterium]
MVVLLVVIVVGLYFLLFAPKNAAQPGSEAATGGGTSATASSTPAQADQGFGVISDEPVLDYSVDGANVVTAIEPNGEIIQVANGQTETVSSLPVQDILNAGFSYDGTKVLVNFGDPTNPQTSIFDLATKTWTPMPAGWQSPVWSPSDYRVAYRTDSPNGTESFATFDTSKPKGTPTTALTLHAQDMVPAWPWKNQLAVFTKPTAYAAGSAWLYDLQKKTLAPVAIEVPGLEIAWNDAPASSTVPSALRFAGGTAGYGGSLALINLSQDQVQRLSIATLPSKCSFADATSTAALYCGVPRDQNQFSFSVLPDAYNQMALFTSDDVYRIDLATGNITPVFTDPSRDLDVSDLKLFNNTLFFVNR